MSVCLLACLHHFLDFLEGWDGRRGYYTVDLGSGVWEIGRRRGEEDGRKMGKGGTWKLQGLVRAEAEMWWMTRDRRWYVMLMWMSKRCGRELLYYVY